MDKIEFGKGMTIFLFTFRNVKFDKRTEDVYFSLLKNLTSEEFEEAIIKICHEEAQFYPTTNFVALVKDKLKTNENDITLLAWETVLKTIRLIGGYGSVQFQDAAIHSCIELMGGWVELCKTETDDMKWRAKDFREAYKIMSIRKEHKEYLPGVHEINNNAGECARYVEKAKMIECGYGFKRNAGKVELKNTMMEIATGGGDDGSYTKKKRTC